MKIKIKDIDGALPEKRTEHKGFYGDDFSDGYNEAIEDCEETELSIVWDREKLAKQLYENHNYSRTFESNKPKWEDLSESNKDNSGFRWQADTIINLTGIVSIKKVGNV